MLALSLTSLSVPTGNDGMDDNELVAPAVPDVLAPERAEHVDLAFYAKDGAPRNNVCRSGDGTSFSLLHAELKANNLGGKGPWTDSAPEILIGKAGTTATGIKYDVRVRSLGKYEPANSINNGLFDTGGDINIDYQPSGRLFGKINVNGPPKPTDKPTSMHLEFCAVDAKSGKKVTIPQFYFSIFDIDMGYETLPDGTPTAQECVIADGFDAYGLTENTTVARSTIPEGMQFCATTPGSLDDNPKDTENLTPVQKDRALALAYRDTSCFDFKYSISYANGIGRNFLWSGNSALVPMCPTDEPITIHGDPIFKHNGAAHRIRMKGGELETLLNWKHEGRVMELRGRAFGRGTENQWFKQVVVMEDGKEVLDLEAKETSKSDGVLMLKMDGREMLDGKVMTQTHEFKSAVSGIKATAFPHKNKRQRVVVDGLGLSLEVVPQGALKFAKDSPLRDKYRHLNIKLLSGIPATSTGLFAELAGMQKMSAATQSKIEQKFDASTRAAKEARVAARRSAATSKRAAARAAQRQ